MHRVCFLVFFVGGLSVLAADSPADKGSLPHLERALTLLAAAYSEPAVSEDKGKNLNTTAEELGKLCRKLPEPLRFPFVYHEARLVALSGKKSKALKLLAATPKANPILPESIWLEIQLSYKEGYRESGRKRWAAESTLGKLLPMSAWGMLRDRSLAEQQAKERHQSMRDRGQTVIIPKPDRHNLIRIPEIYWEMGFWQESALTYREAIYQFSFRPPDFPLIGRETWMSPETAPLWLRIAKGDAASGRIAWAVQALGLSVMADPSRLSEAKHLLAEIFEPSQVKPKKSLDVAKILEIASLYRENRLHPLAIEAIRLAEQEAKVSLAKKRDEMEKEWIALLAEYGKGEVSEGIAFLFGQDVHRTKPLALIPGRFPYGEAPLF